MNFYAFTCPACAHTFRRILSQVVDTVPCPLCGQAAARDSSAAIPKQPTAQSSADRSVVARPGPIPVCAASDDDEAP